MNAITVDTSDIKTLAADVGRMPGRAAKLAPAVVSKGALNIKNQMRDEASGHAHLPAFPSSITYDIKFGLGSITAEIGPDKDQPQGALGNIYYFGTSKNAPVGDINGPLQSEAPKFEKALGLMADDLLGG